MPEPQSVIIPQPNPAALYLVIKVKNPAANPRAVAQVAARVPALTAEVGAFDPDAKLVSTVGAGDSYIFTQRYVHNLEKWRMLSDKDQEFAIGQRKPDSEELPGNVKPPSAHIARVVIEENGEELQIVRHSLPYGTVSEQGLFFIAYCKTAEIPERMLSRMIGTAGDGLHDRLMEFTRAVSGASFFVPSLDRLKTLA